MLIGLVLSGSPQLATAQPIDSLTARFIKTADSAQHLLDTKHVTEAITLLRTAFRNPARYRSPLGTLHLYYQLGCGERDRGRLEEALAALKQANQLALQLRDTTQLSRIGYKLSVVYADQGNRAAAVAQGHRTVAYSIRPSDTDYKSAVFLLLAELYKDLGNKSLANDYGDRYVRLARQSPHLTYRKMGEWYAAKRLEETGQYRRAIASMTTILVSVRVAHINDKALYLTEMLGDLARIYRQHRQWEPALKAIREALYWGGNYHSSNHYREMAAVLALQGKMQLAVQMGEKAVALTRNDQRPKNLLGALEVLQQIQAQNGQYKAAWLTTNEARQLADSLSTVAKTQAIAQIETHYKVADREIIIQGLQKDKNIRALQATARQQELSAVKRQQFLLLCVVVGLTGLVGIIVFLLVRTRRLQKQTEEQRQLLESQTEELQMVNADKDKLFSIVSHDLRAPVVNLQYLLQDVQQTSFRSDAWPSLVGKLTNRIDQLGRLINNLLYWSLAQQGRLLDRPEQLSIGDIVADCQALLMETIHHKALQVKVSGPDAHVWTDESQIRLIIRNLLDNAVKFAPVGSPIAIHWTNEPTGVSLDVTNHVAVQRNQATGANLGVKVVTELIERQGGSITIDQSRASVWQVRVHWITSSEQPLV